MSSAVVGPQWNSNHLGWQGQAFSALHLSLSLFCVKNRTQVFAVLIKGRFTLWRKTIFGMRDFSTKSFVYPKIASFFEPR
jgi:hypothetical protein